MFVNYFYRTLERVFIIQYLGLVRFMTLSEAMLTLDILPPYFSYRIERNIFGDDVIVVFFGREHHSDELQDLLSELLGGLKIE